MNDMKLKQQVCSLELAKRLKELGVKQESLFYWKDIVGTKEGCFYKEVSMYKDYHIGGVDFELLCSAFTVAELGEMLPYKMGNGFLHCIKSALPRNMEYVPLYLVRYAPAGKRNDYSYETEANTEADARAKMLIYLLENKLTPASQDKE